MERPKRPPTPSHAKIAFGMSICLRQGKHWVALNNGHAYIAGQKTLDPTPVNPMTGAGSALFGVAARVSANGHLEVYFTDDNTNTVDLLK